MDSTTQEVAAGGQVTILKGHTVYDVTQVCDDLARIWPVSEDDPRDGQWVSIDILRPVAPSSVACHYRVAGCTAGPGEHPRGDQTMHAHCPTHSEGHGAVLQHYNRTTHNYECWHCVLERFHAARLSS